MSLQQFKKMWFKFKKCGRLNIRDNIKKKNSSIKMIGDEKKNGSYQKV